MTQETSNLVMAGVITESPRTQKVGDKGSIKTMFKLQGRDGAHSYSIWGNDFFKKVNKGDSVTVWYYESEGRQGGAPFRNVTEWEMGISSSDTEPSAVPPAEHPTIPAESVPARTEYSPGTFLADHPSKRESIERQVALGHALEYAPYDEDATVVLRTAETFYHWISQKGFTGTTVHYCGVHKLYYDGTSYRTGKPVKYHMWEGMACVEGRDKLVALKGDTED